MLEASDGVVSLRKITGSDAERLYQWRMEPASRVMFRNTQPVPYADHKTRIQQHLESGSADCWFVVEAEGLPVGTISMYDFDEDGQACHWGRFTIAEEFRRKGYGRRALALVLLYAKRLKLTRIYCEVLSTNQIALGLYEEMGFTRTAVCDCGGRSFVAMTAELTGRA